MPISNTHTEVTSFTALQQNNVIITDQQLPCINKSTAKFLFMTTIYAMDSCLFVFPEIYFKN